MTIYSTREAAELTGLSVRALRKRIDRGQLRAVQDGRYWRIPRSELQRLGLIAATDRAPADGRLAVKQSDLELLLTALQREHQARKRLARELTRVHRVVAYLTGKLDHGEQNTGARSGHPPGTVLRLS